MLIIKKEYDGESLVDITRDVYEAFIDEFNPEMTKIPKDEYGFHKGTFILTIKWMDK